MIEEDINAVQLFAVIVVTSLMMFADLRDAMGRFRETPPRISLVVHGKVTTMFESVYGSSK